MGRAGAHLRHPDVDGRPVPVDRLGRAAARRGPRPLLRAGRHPHRALLAARRRAVAARPVDRPAFRRPARGRGVGAAVFRGGPERAACARSALGARDLGLTVTSGAAWGVFFASLAAVIAFGPPMLVARGASLGQAGFEVSLAIWVTIVSVPLGGLLSDRVGRPNAFIVVGSLGGAGLLWALPTMPAAALGLVLVGAVIGAAPGPLTSLLPRALAPERLAGGLGVSYT